MSRMIRVVLVVVSVATTAPAVFACHHELSAEERTETPEVKVNETQKLAATIEDEHYARRACHYEARAHNLKNRPRKWRNRLRYLSLAAEYWRMVKSHVAPDCKRLCIESKPLTKPSGGDEQKAAANPKKQSPARTPAAPR